MAVRKYENEATSVAAAPDPDWENKYKHEEYRKIALSSAIQMSETGAKAIDVVNDTKIYFDYLNGTA